MVGRWWGRVEEEEGKGDMGRARGGGGDGRGWGRVWVRESHSVCAL